MIDVGIDVDIDIDGIREEEDNDGCRLMDAIRCKMFYV